MEVLRQQPPLENNHYMGYHSLSTLDSFGAERLNSKFHLFPRDPPTPPPVMSRISLPSIADILNPSNDDDHSSIRRGRYNSTSNSDPQADQDSTQNQQSQHLHANNFPPTPPLSIDAARDRTTQHVQLLQPSPVSGISSPVFRRESNPQRGYTSTTESRPQINTQPSVLRSPDVRTPQPHSAPTHSSHPYRRSPELRYGRRSQSPRDTGRAAPPHDSRRSLPLPNGPLSPRSSLKGEQIGPRSDLDLSRRKSSGTREQLPSILNSTSSPYPSVSNHHPLQPDYPTSTKVHSLQHQQSYSPQSPPSTQRPPNFTRPRSESWNGRRPHHHLHQHSQPMPQAVLVSPQLPHSNQPLSQVLSAQAAGASDRYICSTCGKCFSRPSSLRIHSHSHTGEKPFRCSREGCGKAFSVRSNMKRHERGCHVGLVPTSVGYPSGLVVTAAPGMLHQGKSEHLGLGVTGLPSMANGMLPMPRELAPAPE